ncbi:peptidyl-prolyl cis-trans isomerase [Bizionia gelidisalsuginis]|uniref:Peptidyl-prolyl cis-trans isomerase n=2 Tax=Bizionia TaxID=283785 RepID=A0A8H2LFJ3_9FLAO|nr:peptidyl-prolyl cis-trans isomerase [Bizionia saleffrena]TYC09735.1 peptidyl-prolyl cis-trans isomerase [Bizionia gelidisalsuginis]
MKNIIYILLATLVSSCAYFKPKEDDAVARANDSYLYRSDLEDVLPENYSKEDSIVLVNNYINQWATRKLLVGGAELNLKEEKQEEFDELVAQYKTDLYSKAYLEALVYKSLDTVVSTKEAAAYYEENKSVFKLNEELIKFRYIKLDPNRLDLNSVETKFKRFNKKDRRELDSISIQLRSFSLNDSVWIRLSQVVNKIPVLNLENKDKLLKKSNFIQLDDSLGLYLMQINDVLLRNDTAPLEYVKPTIRQIVVNRRKLELIKQLEKDITKDAIKNKQFEIYN